MVPRTHCPFCPNPISRRGCCWTCYRKRLGLASLPRTPREAARQAQLVRRAGERIASLAIDDSRVVCAVLEWTALLMARRERPSKRQHAERKRFDLARQREDAAAIESLTRLRARLSVPARARLRAVLCAMVGEAR